MSKHTPLPWRVFVGGSEGAWIKPDVGSMKEDLKHIGVINGRDLATDIANAEMIVRAVNCHDDLLHALKNLENDTNIIPDHAWKIVQDAIAKAESVVKVIR